ncbi:MAG TPA: DNA-3-methyladenine glycosylase I [Acidimicrobiales bacterium]
MSEQRCGWVGDLPLMVDYHDTEWGVPVHEDQKLFELMVLEAMQAGLSWQIVLNKRRNFEEALDGFDIARIAKYSDKKLERLVGNTGIIRNRQKLAATVINAQASLVVQKEFGSLDAYLWQFVDGQPKRNAWTKDSQIPATNAEAQVMSKELKSLGFKFVGPTICYAFMQAAGLVNDHRVDCFRYKQLTSSSH